MAEIFDDLSEMEDAAHGILTGNIDVEEYAAKEARFQQSAEYKAFGSGSGVAEELQITIEENGDIKWGDSRKNLS